MAGFVINKDQSNEKEVAADWYQQEGEYFVFYTRSNDEKVLTYSAAHIRHIETKAN